MRLKTFFIGDVMLKVYVYSKCSTCQKALKFLKQQNIPFELKEITQTPPTEGELIQMLNHVKGDIKKLFNTSGKTYRDLQLSQKLSKMSTNEALELLASNGMLVKRPFVLAKEYGVVGFREEQWQTVLK